MKHFKNYINESQNSHYTIIFTDANIKDSVETKSSTFTDINELNKYVNEWYKNESKDIMSKSKNLKNGQCFLYNLSDPNDGPDSLLIVCW